MISKLYAYGKRSHWMRNIKMPEWYRKLGATMAQRQSKYRKLFAQYLNEFGKTKQGFLKARFFGPQSWVTDQEKLVTEWRVSSARAAPS